MDIVGILHRTCWQRSWSLWPSLGSASSRCIRRRSGADPGCTTADRPRRRSDNGRSCRSRSRVAGDPAVRAVVPPLHRSRCGSGPHHGQPGGLEARPAPAAAMTIACSTTEHRATTPWLRSRTCSLRIRSCRLRLRNTRRSVASRWWSLTDDCAASRFGDAGRGTRRRRPDSNRSALDAVTSAARYQLSYSGAPASEAPARI